MRLVKLDMTLESSYMKFADFSAGYLGRGRSKSPNAIAGKDIRKFGFKDREIPLNGNKLFIQNIYSAEAGIIASFGGNLEATETVTIFTDGEKTMCRYMLGILHSRLINFYLLKFCFNDSRVTMHADAKYLKKLPLVKKDDSFDLIVGLVYELEKEEYLSEKWHSMFESLNELVYDTYEISQTERDYVESEMKKIQSQKWFYEKRQKM